MAFNFPNSPVENQEFSPQPWITYIYKAPHWIIKTSAAIVGGDDFVNVSGDIMTGLLTLSGPPTIDLHAASKKYVDDNSGGSGDATVAYVDAQDALRVLKTGDGMSGHLALPAGPGATQAVRKDYVDAANTAQDTTISGKLAKAGDTMTGLLTLSAAPTLDLHAATKKYVDDNAVVGGGGISDAEMKAYAAPFDALAYNGMQVNGAMQVNQGLLASTVLISGSFTSHVPADGWRFFNSGVQNLSALAINGSNPPGFRWSMTILPSGLNASPGAGDYASLVHRIENIRVAHLAWGTADAVPITIGFWVKTGRAGTYSGAVLNQAENRSYVFSFTTSGASTWEWKTVTIPGDTTGTWATDTQRGLTIHISMMVGTTYQATAGAWNASTKYGATGTFNGVSSFSDLMGITGVVVLPGAHTPTAAQSMRLVRPYDQELLLCQRYYQQSSTSQAYLALDGGHTIVVYGASVPHESTYHYHSFHIPMRSSPVIKVYPYTTPTNLDRASNSGGTDYPANSAKIAGDSAKSFTIINLSGGALTVLNNYMLLNWTADARL